MREVRFNKIAKLMELSKLAYEIPQDWLDFYRSIKDLDLCQRKEYINDLSQEQAIKFNEVLIDLERMGARLPEELKSDTNLRGLTGREVLCSADVMARITLPFDIIGSFNILFRRRQCICRNLYHFYIARNRSFYQAITVLY
jgi:hypothetical protein